jgi:hypothetical protein
VEDEMRGAYASTSFSSCHVDAQAALNIPIVWPCDEFRKLIFSTKVPSLIGAVIHFATYLLRTRRKTFHTELPIGKKPKNADNIIFHSDRNIRQRITDISLKRLRLALCNEFNSIPPPPPPYLKTETYPVSKRYVFYLFRIQDDGQSPETQ